MVGTAGPTCDCLMGSAGTIVAVNGTADDNVTSVVLVSLRYVRWCVCDAV